MKESKFMPNSRGNLLNLLLTRPVATGLVKSKLSKFPLEFGINLLSFIELSIFIIPRHYYL